MTTIANMITVERNPENAKPMEGQRMITVRFRNPSRSATVCIANTAWANLASVPETYRALLEGVLETAARKLLGDYLNSFGTWPSEINAAVLSEDKILEQAAGNNSDWLTKEELEAAWKASATRRAFLADARYSANPAYRKAVAAFEGLILKLSGKTSQFKPEELDKMLAKIADDDLTGEFGMFVVRRIENIRNKPAKVTEADLDLL